MRRGVALAAMAVAAAVAAETAPTAVPVELANPAIDELSGLALSRADAGVIWGHNDTGGGPMLYRFGPDGGDLGSLRIRGVRSSDWEDIAAFEHRGKPALLIADVGDNLGARVEVVLYAVSDPGRTGPAELLWHLPFRYPDGPRDCEAVAVDPVAREILLISKRDEPPRLYRLALPARTPAEPATAERIGTLENLPPPAAGLGRLLRPYLNAPTGLDISRDGATAVVVTPRQAFVYRRAPGQGWAQAFARPAATLELPLRGQVEAVALSADGRTLVVGSEGRPGRLARIALPQ